MCSSCSRFGTRAIAKNEYICTSCYYSQVSVIIGTDTNNRLFKLEIPLRNVCQDLGINLTTLANWPVHGKIHEAIPTPDMSLGDFLLACRGGLPQHGNSFVVSTRF